MFPASLLTTLLLVLVVAGKQIIIRDSPITFPVARRLKLTGGVQNLVRKDLARAQALRARAAAISGKKFQVEAVFNEPVINEAVSYIATVGIGIPPTNYSLIIDTGSSNTWVGAGIPYVRTNSSKITPYSVSVSYGSGSFSGTEYTDTVTLAPGLVIKNQSIGVASTASGFSGTDGILGIGPTVLTQGTLSPATSQTVPTVTDNAFSQGLISAYEVSISFQPTTSTVVTNGELTWGGTDSSKYTGSIKYTPLTTTSPASYYWGINQSIRYGTSTNILSSTAGIVDTGTTLLLIASDAYNTYVKATGAVLDNTTGLLRISSANYAKLQSLFFTTNGVTYEFTANAQLWPRSLNTYIGGTTNNIYLVVSNLGTPSGQGLDFINGYAFLERFYSVFDTANKQVGFATTPYTTATTN